MSISIFSMTFSGSGFVLVNIASNGCCCWIAEPFSVIVKKHVGGDGGDGRLNVGSGGVGSRLKLLNGGGGACGGGTKLLNVGGEKLLLLLLKKLSPLKASSLFCMSLVSPVFDAFLTRLLSMSFLPISSSPAIEPATGFCASNVETSWKTSSEGFCIRKKILWI